MSDKKQESREFFDNAAQSYDAHRYAGLCERLNDALNDVEGDLAQPAWAWHMEVSSDSMRFWTAYFRRISSKVRVWEDQPPLYS